MPSGSWPLNPYPPRSHPAWGNAWRRLAPRRSTCQRRSMSSSSASDRPCSWARCSGVMELSRFCMAAIWRASCSSSSSSVAGDSGKKSPNWFMNCSKASVVSWPRWRISSISFRAVEHVLHALQLLGRGVGHGPGHLVEVALHQLLAQLVEQLVETLPSLRRRPLVLLQLPHLARQVGWQQVELQPPLRRHLVGDLLAALVARLAGLLLELVDAGPLHPDDVPEALRDVVVDPAQVVALQLVAPAPAQPFQQLPHARHLFPVAVPEPLLHHAPQRLVEVAVVEQIVGDLRQDVAGVQFETDLAAVPPGVLEAAHRTRDYVRRQAPPAAPEYRRPP